MCPPEKEIAEAEESVGDDEFDMDQARQVVMKMSEKTEDVDDIVEAYKTMAEDDPEGKIEQKRLWQKMRRRLPTDEMTNQMIREAKPDASGMIDIKDFVQRQFDVRELSIRLPKMRTEPSLEQVKSSLAKIYGNENGPGYAYRYKTKEELIQELSGHGEETRKFLDFGREQRSVLREAIAFEIKSKVVEQKLGALRQEANPYKAALLLRELDSFHTGYKFLDDLADMEMQCALKMARMRRGKEADAFATAVKKVQDAKKRICNKWRMYKRGGFQ